MKFSFSAEVQAHIEPFFRCVLKGGRGRSAVNPKSCNTHCCGMPSESAHCADVRFIQRLPRRMLMVRFVLDMCTSTYPGLLLHELRDFVAFAELDVLTLTASSASLGSSVSRLLRRLRRSGCSEVTLLSILVCAADRGPD